MKSYTVRWSEQFERIVEADSKDQAEKLALDGADYDKDYVECSAEIILIEEKTE